MKDVFAEYHPGASFAYFALVLALSMVLSHPLAQALLLLGALSYSLLIQGRKGAGFALKFCLPLVLLTALANLLFSRQGQTILFTLPTGLTVTLESALYGLSAGAMIITVLLWFGCFNRVLSADKFLYLFSRRIPALSLILSMTFRFIPRFRIQLEAVSDAQRALGRDVRQGPLRQRLHTAITILSIMISWALENAIDTADSMKSRGYSTGRRSSFSVYPFQERDRWLLLWLGFCGLYLAAGALAGAFSWSWFPRIAHGPCTPLGCSFYLVLALLAATPIILNLQEVRKWNSICSKT